VADDAAALVSGVQDRLLALGATVGVAESLTGGLLSAALTSRAGSSAVFRGGLVVYATDTKESVAGVPGPLLAAEGPVSAPVAAALAAGARDRLHATYGVGITGVAGPDRQDDQPVGTVHVAVAGPDVGDVRSLRLDGDRVAIREQAVRHALLLLSEVLERAGG
jgi:nicotinamide-nucleotide amidase